MERLNGSRTAHWDHEPSAGRGWFMERIAAPYREKLGAQIFI
jgi:hypothetical protein